MKILPNSIIFNWKIQYRELRAKYGSKKSDPAEDGMFIGTWEEDGGY